MSALLEKFENISDIKTEFSKISYTSFDESKLKKMEN